MNKLVEMEKNEQEDNNSEDYEEEEGDILSGSCCLLSQLRIRFL